MPSTLRFSPRRFSSAKICAQVEPARDESKRFFRVEEDCDRPFIDEFHGHHSLKDTGCDDDAKAAERFAELVVESLRQLRRGGRDETRTALAARVTIERKLGNDEGGTFHVQKRKVHFLLRIFEDAQVGDFFRKRSSDGAGILFANA